MTAQSSDSPKVDLADLGMASGGHLLVERALRRIPVGGTLRVFGRAQDLSVELAAWCRSRGHEWRASEGRGAPVGEIVRGSADTDRWHRAERAGHPDPTRDDAVVARPPDTWGLAARGALVEAGMPEFQFGLAEKDVVWTEEARRIYLQAAAAQWDPETAIPWEEPIALPDEVEDAVVQVMTYLIENEAAALIVPSRFLARLHPHFKEVMQCLAIQAADEARHIEVFTRRALLNRSELGTSTVGGQVSLKTLLDEPDFALASFLLSVLGEGSFLSLLWFLYDRAPDPVTRRVAQLSAQDEARHVAFGMAHLKRHLSQDPTLPARLAMAVRRRHDALRQTAGLNQDVFDALVVIAAGSWAPEAIQRGVQAVSDLEADMNEGRQRRLVKLGFEAEEAAALSVLHTRNFM